MKLLLLLIFFFLYTSVSATDYYISASGNDANTGLSTSTSWKTIAKVNSAFTNMKPGDQILFNRGDTFYGSLVISKSGTSGSPISIGAYGIGASPTITGFTMISGWSEEDGNIYSKTIAVDSNFPNMVLVDGVNTAMGRYPNLGTWLTYESHSGSTSYTDNQLTNTPNWTGSEAVIRKTRWVLSRNLITNHTNSVLTITPADEQWDSEDGCGYFIQHDLKTLDIANEWFYNGSKFYIYSNPSAKTVKISTVNRLLVINSKNYIKIENITFEGANSHAIQNTSGQNITIQNCSFLNIGMTGIYTDNNSVNATMIIEGNTFDTSNNNAIHLRGTNTYGWVKNNTIRNTGLIKGSDTNVLSEDLSNAFDAITVSGANSIIEYNTILNTGHSGICIRLGSGIIIRNNFISNFGLTRYDAGGIYTFNISGATINNNITDGSNTISEGIAGSSNVSLFGIYSDERTQNINIYNNTVTNVRNAGFLYLNSKTGTFRNNTSFNNGIQYAMTYAWNYGYNITEMNIKNNIFVSKTALQPVLNYRNDVSPINQFGVADSNYYVRPIDNNQTIQTQIGSSITNRTFEGWKTLTSQDANSQKSQIIITQISDIEFYYNETKTNKTISLSRPMIDVKGAKYSNSITLLPFTSAVLMVDSDPVIPTVPLYVSSAVGNATPLLLEMTYDLSLANIVPATSAFSVLVNSVARTVSAVAITGAKVQLTLASAILFGDIVTVAYTKSVTSPLQTTSAGQAASITAQAVTNSINPPVPVYVSSAVGNATPSLIEMTYDLSLANIIPATSAFTILVNSIARTVSAVAISGTKVQLTLASVLLFGDVVTVAYTKPATSPLQTTSAGQAASITAKTVTNSIYPPVPVFVSSAVGNATPSLLEMTYSLSLANIVPATFAFTVLVNSVARTVSAVAISGTKVQLTLASAILFGDVVTVAYTKPVTSPLQTTSAGQAASITAKAVTNGINPPVPVYVSSTVGNVTPSLIEMTYSLSLANIVPATPAFTVLVNSVARTVSAVAITGTKVQLTLASVILFGDVVTVAYTKPATSLLQTTSTGQAASITAKAVTNSINPPVPVYISSAVGNATPSLIEMTYSLNLANIVPATSAFTVQVNSLARTVSAVTITGTKVQLTLASAILFGDVVTVAYTKPATSPLQTSSTGQAASITAQAVTNSTNPPVPVFVSSAVGNATPSLLEMTYSLSLANIVPAASAFTVLVNSVARTVNAVAISGTKVQLTLASAILFGDVVTVTYTKPALSPLQTTSAGQAASISAQIVTNNVSAPVPVYLSAAVGNTTPSVLEMTYNLSLANIVPATSAFTVLVNSVARTVSAVAITGTRGLLSLNSDIVYGDIVTVAYTRPSSNPIQTTSAGMAASVSAQEVTNNVNNLNINESHFIPVWQGENGTNHMNLIVVSATLENLPLSADDEISVFSGSNCVGSMKLTESINPALNSTFLVIPASQDDGSNNGFVNNDSIIFKIWDHTNQREMGTNVVKYKTNIPTWLTNGKYSAGGTSVVEIATYTENTQTIELLRGYNLISTYITPEDPNVSAVTKQLIDQGELIKVQDEAGNSFENWSSLGGWINKLGSFERTEGYKIKVANNCTLRLTGRPIVLPLDISLKSGWNIISFPRTDLVDAMDIIQSLIDQNKLIKVQDEAGNSIENWGIFGGWKNAIGNFTPGKAYKVKSNADAVITIHENYLKSAAIPATAASAEYFSTKIEGNGTDHMNINIVGLREAGLSVGDELAAFDGDVCVGALKITKNQIIDGTAGLVASASTDSSKPDGFKEGNIIRIAGWNKLTNKEFQVQTELLNGQLNYQKEASVLVRMGTITPDAKGINDLIKIKVYPNPCKGKFTVRFSAIPEAGSRIDIMDISGRNILSRGILDTAEEFNLDHQQPGIYIVKTIIGSTQTNHKLIIY